MKCKTSSKTSVAQFPKVGWLCKNCMVSVAVVYVYCWCPAVTHTMIVTMDGRRPARCVECVRAPRVSRVIRCIVSSTPSFRGVCRTLGTVTTTGQDCTEDWSGTASSARPSPIRNRWENRSANQRAFAR